MPGSTPPTKPARLAQLDDGNDRAILVQGDEGPAQVVRLVHQGTPSVGYSDDGAISSPPAPYHLSPGERWIRTFSTAARRPGISEASGRLRAVADEVCVTLRWREMDSNPRSPVKKNPLVATVLFGLPAFPFRERPRVRKPS